MVTTKRTSRSQVNRVSTGAVQQLLLNIPEVCESLRLSRAKVYRLIYDEGLPVVHFGRAARMSVTALQAWKDQREKGT